MLKQLFRDLGQGISSLLFPAVCIVCNQRLEPAETLVCRCCWDKLNKLPDDIIKEKQIPESLDSIRPVFEFDDRIQAIIHGLKYRGYKSLGVRLGKIVADQLRPDFFHDGTILIPVPLHPIKKRERGYNQAEYIAEGIAATTDLTVRTDLLKRVKNTVTQTHLDARERQVNMQNAFAVKNSGCLNGVKSVILVDDVFTTGATMNAAASVLKSHGVGSVSGLTVAAPV